jgi:hypothetical protein
MVEGRGGEGRGVNIREKRLAFLSTILATISAELGLV